MNTFLLPASLCPRLLFRKDRGELSGGKPLVASQQGDDLPIRGYKEASWSREPHQLWSSIAEETRMEGCFWKTLLVVGALATGGTSSLQHKSLSYDEAVDLAVSIYNSKSGEDSMYRLLEAVPQPEWDPLSESNQELNFTIKETECQVEEERSLKECDFEEDGVVMECRGYYFFGETPSVLVLTCEPVAEEEEGDKEEEKEVEEEEKEEDEKDQPRRVKRFKKFFKKLKKSVKKRVKKFFKKPRVIGVSIPF
ncbi:cathelicidin-related peptide Oh-Cath-like [Pantherophis guttatus]|uniref:Vipericidin n=1 Tax=Pantherophis guttatus TaxID=94885 RepID=A0ABM3YWY9_PANGU|nr:cathelicidin-related peptide Oh-Cath-like [Pantherophis guttatus]